MSELVREAVHALQSVRASHEPLAASCLCTQRSPALLNRVIRALQESPRLSSTDLRQPKPAWFDWQWRRWRRSSAERLSVGTRGSVR